MEIKYTLKEIRDAAARFWEANKGNKIFAFHGEMGLGKTTFIQSLCDLLGVTDLVSSPTFSIINEYEYSVDGEPSPVFHIDLYRINDKTEAERAGVEDCIYSKAICFIEWPERAPDLFPEDTIHVFFTIVDDQTRMIRIGDI